MFEIRKSYTITTWEGSEDGGLATEHPDCEVVEFQFPVLKVRQHGRDWIINISSPAFAGAAPKRPRPAVKADFGDDEVTFSITTPSA